MHGIAELAERLLASAIPNLYDELRARWTHGRYPYYFDSTRSIFIHVPKTAGLSIALGLYGEQVGHHTWRYWYNLNPRKFRNYYSFAVVRDPVSRFISAFSFLKSGGMDSEDRAFADRELEPYGQPSDLAEALGGETVRKSFLSWVHFRPQADFVADDRGCSSVDMLIAFEDLETGFDKVRRRVNPDCILPHLNKRMKRRGLAPLSRAGVDVLRSIYELDFGLVESVRGSQGYKEGR